MTTTTATDRRAAAWLGCVVVVVAGLVACAPRAPGAPSSPAATAPAEAPPPAPVSACTAYARDSRPILGRIEAAADRLGDGLAAAQSEGAFRTAAGEGGRALAAEDAALAALDPGAPDVAAAHHEVRAALAGLAAALTQLGAATNAAAHDAALAQLRASVNRWDAALAELRRICPGIE